MKLSFWEEEEGGFIMTKAFGEFGKYPEMLIAREQFSLNVSL